MAKLLDGRAAAAAIKESLRVKVASLSKVPSLGTILVGEDPASISYINGKHRDCAEVGIKSVRVELPKTSSKDEICAAVERLNKDIECTGFLVQLPLPDSVDTEAVLSAIDPLKDVDGLHPLNLGRLVLDQEGIKPCTPIAIIELLKRNQIEFSGRDVVIIGRGNTVGRPLSMMLSSKKVNATVTTVHSRTKDLATHTQRADIVIVAAGSPRLLTASMIKFGAVIVDVGLTRTETGLVGDVADDVRDRAGWITPVPGGVGPMTRAMLLSNLVEIASR
jgi:methylenetetrahydrofolate dehydrogenase (NADP+)/methenyltetrahydrofolate cyclohydrolase